MVFRLYVAVLVCYGVDGGYPEQGHGAVTIARPYGGLSAAPDGFASSPETLVLPSAVRWVVSYAWPCIVAPAFAHSTALVVFFVVLAGLSSRFLCPGPSSFGMRTSVTAKEYHLHLVAIEWSPLRTEGLC